MSDQLKNSVGTLEALRRAEQKYRSIFEHCLEGVFQTTPEGKYISANPALARMYGYDSAEELIADRCFPPWVPKSAASSSASSSLISSNVTKSLARAHKSQATPGRKTQAKMKLGPTT